MTAAPLPARFPLSAILILAAALAGCGSYELRGRVIEGTVSSVFIVPDDDPRLLAPIGLTDTSIALTLDPATLGRKPLGSTLTSPDGYFSIPISEVGAGTLEYHVGILVRRTGFAPAEQFLTLPNARKRVLVTLTRGADRIRRADNPLDDLKRYAEPIKP